MLDAAVVTAVANGRTEVAARNIERNSINMVNVMSAKAMEMSPDITVANVIKRMSGVTVERNSSGEGQYAILRGMDKRYNYTLVNGIKIPSPDNKNRFVPLDIFPSEILDRIEVTKSLTADMEGDGIGGAVNLVMKDAPEKMEISANLSTGYSALFLARDFQSFNHRAINPLSPNERLGRPELHDENYSVTADDFSMENLHVTSHRPRPDIVGGFSYGDRFSGAGSESSPHSAIRIFSGAKTVLSTISQGRAATVPRTGTIRRNRTVWVPTQSLTTEFPTVTRSCCMPVIWTSGKVRSGTGPMTGSAWSG